MTIEQEVRGLLAALVRDVTAIARQHVLELFDESVARILRRSPSAKNERRSGRTPSAQPMSKLGATLTLAEAEAEHIARVMADTGGNISEAARRLGISRSSLQRRFKRS